MRQNVIRLILVASLIVLCIWQTTILWLGDMSSHNFLAINQKTHNTILAPKTIWVHMGSGKLTYNLDEGINYLATDVLMDELITSVKNNKLKITKEPALSYESLLQKPGIVYEYGTSLTFNEMMGTVLIKEYQDVKLSNLFIDLSHYSEYKANIYLVASNNLDIYQLEINERLESHQTVIESFSNGINSVGSYQEYQASLTSKRSIEQYIQGNVFLPLPRKINSVSSAIIYEQLDINNIFWSDDIKETQKKLESYVNTFFSNPSLKEVDITTSGSITYRENTTTSVKYNPNGTLEFNVATASESNKLTNVDKIVMIQQFIESCEGIPDYLRDGLYLSKIKDDILKGETTYLFDYKTSGFNVLLSEAVKDELGLEAIMELTIKNNQIVHGKWSMLRIEVSERVMDLGELKEDYNTVISDFYAREEVYEDEPDSIQDIQCSYRIEGLQEPIRFGWTIYYKGHIYYL